VAVLSHYARAVTASFRQQWKQMFFLESIASPIIGALGPAIVIGWVAGHSGNMTAMAYVFIGASLSMMWNTGIFRTGRSLASEHVMGTLDLLMTTRTPLPVLMFGKALAVIAFGAINGLVTFAVVLAFTQRMPAIDSTGLFLAAAVVALIAVVVSSFLFAPLSYLVGVRSGFFNAIMPFGAVVSGFLYPIDVLPAWLEAVARCLPTAWAMEAAVHAIEASASDGRVLADLAVAIGLSAALLAVSCVLFLKAERRVRITGDLGVM
jgi:ABC-2 type transport system permease protein